MRPEGIDLQAGYRIMMSDGFSTKELIVSSLEVTGMSLSTRTVTGIYDPNLNFSITTDVQGQPGALVFDGTQWVATFAELTGGDAGEVYQLDEDGDRTTVVFYLDYNNHIWADPNGWIGGFEWVAGETITVNVYDLDNVRVYTADQVVQTGRFPWNGHVGFYVWRECIVLPAGYRVTMSDCLSTNELIISTLEITSVSLSARTITGIYDPNLEFWINVQGQQPENVVFDGTEWVATFANLPAGADGEVGQTDEDGDITFIGYYVPNPSLAVDELISEVQGLELPQVRKAVLLTKLKLAKLLLNQGRIPAAKLSLYSFIQQVERLERLGLLSEETANKLVSSAQQIIAIL
jgi:hypothetical protein